jgi:hypothetical protein
VPIRAFAKFFAPGFGKTYLRKFEKAKRRKNLGTSTLFSDLFVITVLPSSGRV